MPKKIDIIKNKVSKRVSEGNELLTVMVIPHSEKRIFSFQISFLTLFFLCFIIASLVVVAFFALRKHPETLKKQRRFEYKNIKYMHILNKFISLTEGIKNKEKHIQGSFVNLLASAGHVNSKNINLTNSYRGNKLPIRLYIVELQKLLKFSNKIKSINSKTRHIIKFINHFKSITREIPSVWPLVGSGVITSGFGNRIDPFTMRTMFHPGVDISAFPSTPIRATASGLIKSATYSDGTGKMVLIEHKYGYASAYMHMESFAVSEGDRVKRGEIIGYVGNTGRSVGYHLHYEVRLDGKYIDPLPYLRFDVF